MHCEEIPDYYNLRTTSIPYTFLRNGGYTEFFVNPSLKADVENGTILYNLVSNYPWSFDDLAEILSEVSGKSVVHPSVSLEEEKNILVRAGMPESITETTAFIYNTIAEGKMARTTDDLQKTPIKELVIKALQG